MCFGSTGAMRVDEIDTVWNIVYEAQSGSEKAVSAQAKLWERYGEAVRRYLRAAVRDAAAAEDLLQDFALIMTQTGFRNVDHRKGRFRDYLKSILCRLVYKHRRRQ